MAWTNPRTWIHGEFVTSDLLNTELRDNLRAIGDPWTAFTPALVGSWTVGNGSLEGWHIKAGRLVMAKATFTFGSTSSASGPFGLMLPWSHANGTIAGGGTADGLPVGQAVAFDASAKASFYRHVLVNTSTLRVVDDSSVLVNARVPFRWADGDVLAATFTIETTA